LTARETTSESSREPKAGEPAFRAFRLLSFSLLGVALLWGLYRVFELSWVADDAFISFRYASNLAFGHGLVFNVGERVEGYTNFLWTLLVALGLKLHLDPVHLTQVLGALAYAATTILLAHLSRRMAELPGPRYRLFVPAAALAFAVQFDAQVWATGGLETMTVTALVVAGFALFVSAKRPHAHVLAGMLFVAAALARPDALLFYLAALGYLAVEGRSPRRNLLWLALPLMVVFVPYWLWRWVHFGYFFPNSYYAKSGGVPYYGQGLAYLGLYVKSYYVFWLVPVAAIHLIWLRRARLYRHPVDLTDRVIGASLLFLVVYSAYVVRVGGDFMFARFLIPVTPFAFLLLECWLWRWTKSGPMRIAVALLLVGAVLARRDLYADPRAFLFGVAQEWSWYPDIWRQDREEFGRTLHRCLEGTDARLAFAGTYAAAAYYADLPYAFEYETGLTDTAIAHRPISARGRPGHEKRATLEDLVARNIQILLYLPRTNPSSLDPLATVQFGYRSAILVMYDRALMQHLEQFDDVSFVNIPDYLDLHTPEITALPDSTFLELDRFFRAFYFDHNPDSMRVAPFDARLATIAGGKP